MADPGNGLLDIYQGANTATLPNRTRELITAMRANNSAISDADLTNTLVAAYCPVLAQTPGLSLSDKQSALKDFIAAAQPLIAPTDRVETVTGGHLPPCPPWRGCGSKFSAPFLIFMRAMRPMSGLSAQLCERAGCGHRAGKGWQRIVGAATCLPLAAETPNVQKPFIEAGMDLSRLFYFGESVLDPAYRGRGIGVAFFKAREAQAAGYQTTCFCAVQRPADHPLRPKTYVPLDEFWRTGAITPG